MIKTSKVQNIKYVLLALAVGLIQFLGYEAAPVLVILLMGFSVFSFSHFYNSLKRIKTLYFFIFLSIILCLYNIIRVVPEIFSLMVWGQFLFALILAIGIPNKDLMLNAFFKVILIIFFLDLASNLALFTGFDLHWIKSHELVAREGSDIIKYPGIKDSHLFSGLISFLTLTFALEKERIKSRKLRYAVIFLCIINLSLSFASRSIILSIAVLVLKVFPSIRNKKVFLASFFMSTIIMVIILVHIKPNNSNLLRVRLWENAIEEISEKPIAGHGIHYADTRDKADISANFGELSKIHVTESFILAVAYSFGIPTAIFFVIFLLKTIFKTRKFDDYHAAAGIFVGLSVELFFADSINNLISCFLFFLSASIICLPFTSSRIWSESINDNIQLNG